MENIDLNKLSKLYPQLDALNPEEKGEAINYLVNSLNADTKENDVKINTEVIKKTQELTEIISETPVLQKTKTKEADEHTEKLTADDFTIYIHGNPRGHKTVGEVEYRHKDPLLKGSLNLEYYTPEIHKQILARDIGNLSTEYTIIKPSCGESKRQGGYVGLTIVLKNGYKIKDTGELPPQGISKNYDGNGNTEVEDFMDKFMQYFIENCGLTDREERDNLVQRKYYDENSTRKVVLHLKEVFMYSMNEEEENKGLIIKDNF